MLKKLILKFPSKLFLIILFALFLRTVAITENPPSLYGDELTMVMDVNSILHTGFDQTGEFLPLNFIMGGGRPVGYGYFSLPFVAFFGPNALGIRLLSVLSGVGIVFLVYCLGRILFSEKVGLLSAMLMAISPWDLNLSRGGFETHFALFLALLTVVTVLLALKKPIFLLISAISLGLSINTYSTYKLTLPAFLPMLFWFGEFKAKIFGTRNRTSFFAASMIVLFFVLLLLYQVFFNSSEARFLNQNILANKDIQKSISEKIEAQRSLGLGKGLTGKILANKFWEYNSILIENYLGNFSLDFLFLSGDKNPRHNMTLSGGFYLVELITIISGLIFLIKRNSKKLILLVSWLLIGALPASLLSDPHALRNSFMLPPFILISAVGLSNLWELRKKLSLKIILWIVLVGFLIQAIFIIENLYFVSPNKYSRFWAYPGRLAAELAVQNKEKYDYVFLSSSIDNIEFTYPVYGNINPEKVLEQNKKQTSVGGYMFKKFDNVYIGPIPDSAAQKFLDSFKGVSILYIAPIEDVRYLDVKFYTVNGKDGKQALVTKIINKRIN